MAKLLHIFYHKEGTFSLLCQQVQLITVSRKTLKRLICNFLARSRKLLGRAFILPCIRKELPVAGPVDNIY